MNLAKPDELLFTVFEPLDFALEPIRAQSHTLAKVGDFEAPQGEIPLSKEACGGDSPVIA